MNVHGSRLVPTRALELVAAACVLLTAACAPAPRSVPSVSPATTAVDSAEQHEHQQQHDHGHAATLPPVNIPAGASYTEADVRFMQHMIAHHAQAIHMSRMATTRGADARLLRLAQKIDLSQAGEIALMQDWLRANRQAAPDTSSWRTMTMAGMLTAQELRTLEAARGAEFDRLYLQLMIRHHEGALQMVAELRASPRAAQDVHVSILADDVETTQTAEIGLMRQMLLGY